MNHHSTAHGRIVGLVAAVPANVITNADCPIPAAADEAAKITGVLERRWVKDGQTAATLCTAAARRLLAGMGWDAADLDLIVYVTQTPERAVPADVYSIAAELGATCPCLQVNWSCSGYVNGLWTAMRLLEDGQRALLLVGDANSEHTDSADRGTFPLFGDAGSATAITGGGPAQHFVMGTDGTGAAKLCRPGFQRYTDECHERHVLEMDGPEVFNFTLRTVPEMAERIRTFYLGGARREPDIWLLHQANAFMLRHLSKKAGLGVVPTNIERFGNTSCASIPLLMATPPVPKITPLTNSIPAGPITNVAWRLKNESLHLGMMGFGAGWAHAGASITTEPLRVCELLEV